MESSDIDSWWYRWPVRGVKFTLLTWLFVSINLILASNFNKCSIDTAWCRWFWLVLEKGRFYYYIVWWYYLLLKKSFINRLFQPFSQDILMPRPFLGYPHSRRIRGFGYRNYYSSGTSYSNGKKERFFRTDFNFHFEKSHLTTNDGDMQT